MILDSVLSDVHLRPRPPRSEPRVYPGSFQAALPITFGTEHSMGSLRGRFQFGVNWEQRKLGVSQPRCGCSSRPHWVST